MQRPEESTKQFSPLLHARYLLTDIWDSTPFLSSDFRALFSPLRVQLLLPLPSGSGTQAIGSIQFSPWWKSKGLQIVQVLHRRQRNQPLKDNIQEDKASLTTQFLAFTMYQNHPGSFFRKIKKCLGSRDLIPLACGEVQASPTIFR